jgi:hypothetical protein
MHKQALLIFVHPKQFSRSSKRITMFTIKELNFRGGDFQICFIISAIVVTPDVNMHNHNTKALLS